MAGLYLEKKRSFGAKKWFISFAVVAVLAVGIAMIAHWYVTGIKPVLIPLPASALVDPTVDETEVTEKQVDEHKVGAQEPRYISIPALGIEKSRVQSVGLDKNRELNTPNNIFDTGWFDESATPGQGSGAVIIDGHNGGATKDGVFAKLADLKDGDEIIIERGDGEKFTYKVVENRTESLQDANRTGMKRLFTPYDKTIEGLGLITCAGNWIPKDQVYDKRVLVRAVIDGGPVGEVPDVIE